MTWTFLNTGFRAGDFNMSFDEMMARHLNDGVGSPALRVYGWAPYAISIGYHQEETDFDSEKLSKAGIDLVRRPTGGKAIFHAQELTYSVVINITEHLGPRAIYRFINEGLLEGLRMMGIEAELAANQENFHELYQDPSSIPCFATSAKHEIQYHGKKLVGSAQRRFGNVILQHGSILLGPEHRNIVDFLSPHVQDHRDIMEHQLLTHTVDIESILNRQISFDQAAEYIRRGCGNKWDIEFISAEAIIHAMAD